MASSTIYLQLRTHDWLNLWNLWGSVFFNKVVFYIYCSLSLVLHQLPRLQALGEQVQDLGDLVALEVLALQ